MSTRTTLLTILWASSSAWYYGYHISELNYPAESLSCYPPTFPPKTYLPLCLGLSKELYGFVTAIFTAGGLVGSLSSSYIVQKRGMQGGITITGWLNLLGVAMMTLAPHWGVLALGRFLSGLSSGVAICIVPPYLSALSKSSLALSARSGQIGTMNQMAIVLGICCAQIAGLAMTGQRGEIPGSWRYVVAFPGIVSIVQIYTATLIPSTPPPSDKPASTQTAEQFSDDVEAALAVSDRRDEVVSPLLPSPNIHPNPPSLASSTSSLSAEPQYPLRTLLSTPALRVPTLLCASILVLQQLSGVNAVLFYSTPVLRPLLPTGAGVVGVGITVVNALMTLPAVFLVDKLGRKPLLLTSIAGMGITSLLLAYGLDHHHQVLSGIAIVSFIAAFAIGFGPVPFLLVSEMVPAPAIPALSSLSLSLSWISNFLIALLFLPLRDALAEPANPFDPPGASREGEGRVFYVFAAVLVVSGVTVFRGLQGGIKG